MSRRQMVKTVAGCGAAAVLGACAQPREVTKEVTKVETVPVEQTVVVKETVVVPGGPVYQQATIETLWCCARPVEDVPNYEKLNAAFQEAYPGLKVNLGLLPGGQDYFEKLNTLLAAGSPPDVFDMWEGYVQPYASRGALLNLDPFFEDDEFVSLDDLIPTAREAGSWKGNVYAFGSGVMPGPASLYYNPDHFDAAGMRYPNSDWTWDEMRTAAKQLTLDTNGDGEPEQWGLTFENWFVTWLYWIWSNGGDVFNKDETQCTLTGAKVATPGDAVETMQGSLNGFITGAISMYLGYSWDVDTLTTAEEQGCKWKAVLAPKANDGYRSWYLHFGCLSIATLCKIPQEAWLYTRYFMLNGFKFFGSGKAIPALKQQQYLFTTERTRELGYDALLPLLTEPGVMRIPGAGAKWDKISTLIQGELDLAFLGETTAAEAAAAACPLVEDELNRS
jgi:multiple sugar transport system substrate-binding protein